MSVTKQPYIIDGGLIVNNGTMQMPSQSSRSSSPTEGMFYLNTATHSIDFYNNSTWFTLLPRNSWSVITNNLTIGASANDVGYMCNTTSSAFTVTLPATPSAGVTRIIIADYAGTFGTNNLTVNPNSLKINGSSSNLVLNANNSFVVFQYIDSTRGWITGNIAGLAGGIATLDSTGKVPTSQLPSSILGGMTYQGTWNASTNTPTLVSGAGTKGYYYTVSVAGTTTLDGTSTWSVGDFAAFDGTKWERIVNGQAGVFSVAGKTGAVLLTVGDVSGAAPVASPTFTGTPNAPTQSNSDTSTAIATDAYVNNTTKATTSVSVAGGSNVSITAAQFNSGALSFTGAITANITVNVPAQMNVCVVTNNTTGTYSLSMKAVGGTKSVSLPQSQSILVYCDGTDVYLASSAGSTNSFTPYPFVATSGQTVFGCSYTPNNIMVFQNGLYLPPTEYTATDGATVVLNIGANVGDDVLVVALSSFSLINANFTGTVTVPTVAYGDNTTNAASTAYVQRTVGNSSGHAWYSANATLSSIYLGRIIGFTGSSSFTITLPLVASIIEGGTYKIVNFTSVTQTLVCSGSDYIVCPTGASVTYFTVLPGETIEIVGMTNGWDLVGGSLAQRYAKNSSSSISVAGGSNVTLPLNQIGNGNIILSGTITANINVVVPNSFFGIIENTTTGSYTITIKTSGGTGFVIPQNSLPYNVVADGTNVYCPDLNVLKTGGNLSAPINANLGTALASAATVNIGAATGEYLHITGTATITAFDAVQAGTERTVVFDSSLILTYNATSLILPTAANITTQAGDVAKFRSEGSGNWKCVGYIRNNGTPLVVIPMNSMIRLNTGNTTGSINTRYKRFSNVTSSSGSDITYTDSATLGASFTIVNTGIYSISFSESVTAANSFGITLNDSQPTTQMASTTAANILAASTVASGAYISNCSWTGYLVAGSIINAKTDNPYANSGPADVFSIARIV